MFYFSCVNIHPHITYEKQIELTNTKPVELFQTMKDLASYVMYVHRTLVHILENMKYHYFVYNKNY